MDVTGLIPARVQNQGGIRNVCTPLISSNLSVAKLLTLANNEDHRSIVVPNITINAPKVVKPVRWR